MGVIVNCRASLQMLLRFGNLKIYVFHPSSVHNYLHIQTFHVLQTHLNQWKTLEWTGYLKGALLLYLVVSYQTIILDIHLLSLFSSSNVSSKTPDS